MEDTAPDVEFLKIKKKDISVSESLTKERMEALKKARKDYGFENV